MSDLPTGFSEATSWLKDPKLQTLLTALQEGGAEARIVGGAVRDGLLGCAVNEVDLAVNKMPLDVVALLAKGGIKTVPTGIDHGTITAVVAGTGFEITSLRRDIETDGRHAKVTYTTDWQEDAARRDFTFNALYVDAAGTIYDYFNGRDDLTAGRVRFIGAAHERIQEDVLRILRFFRFYAWFGQGEPDKDGLMACTQMASLLPQLSVERVWRELAKLLAAPNPAMAWGLLLDNNILQHCVPEATNRGRLAALLKIEQKIKYQYPDAKTKSLVRLAALLPSDPAVAGDIAGRLNMSRWESEKLQALALYPAQLRGKCDPVPLRRAMYEYGRDLVRDAALIAAADTPSLDIDAVIKLAAAWEKPVFPVKGNDILKLGIAPGPRVGIILSAVLEWWLVRDFHPDRNACLEQAKREIHA